MSVKLTDKQERFVLAYIGEANWNSTKAAEIAGYSIPHQSGYENMKNPEIKARINQLLESVRVEGLGNKAVRIAELAAIHEDLKFIKEARTKEAKLRYENGEDIPESAESGLMVETVKQVGTGHNAVTTTEWSLDKSWVDSSTKVLEQIAREVGDRDKKIELSGPNGGPLQVESGKAKLLELLDDEQES